MEKLPQLNPLSLLDLWKNKILQNDYIVQSLHISYARVLHMFQKGEYIQSSTIINLKATIPRKMARLPNEQMELFCYPEYSSECYQLEPRTLDYSHILTNIHTHICSKGYDFCPREHFVELCEEQPDILSKAVVVDHTDAQNVFTAVCFFGEPVEKFMTEKGHDETATFIRIV